MSATLLVENLVLSKIDVMEFGLFAASRVVFSSAVFSFLSRLVSYYVV